MFNTINFHADDYSWTENNNLLPKTSETVVFRRDGKTLEAKVLKVVHNYVTNCFEVYLDEVSPNH